MFNKIENFVIPSFTDSMDKHMRSQDIFSYLLKYRIIYLSGEVDEKMAAIFNSTLMILNAEDPKKSVFVYVHSPGGCLYSALSMADFAAHISAAVYTVCIFAASAGALILAIGEKIYAYKRSTLMLHQPHGGARGQTTDLAIQVKEMMLKKEMAARIIFNAIKKRGKTTMEYDEFSQKLERDWYLSAQEAFDLGLVDEILVSKI